MAKMEVGLTDDGRAYAGEVVQQARTSQTEMLVTRQAQEVQAAMIIAKRFPRDTNASFERIMDACKRRSLAEQAVYMYPKGGTKVSGPSIRLAEAIAQNWGNIDFGITELEQKDGESQVMAYAWDLETNSRQTKIFTVKHIRHTKGGDYPLTDPRDIYELVANNGARRLRACILGIVPGDVVEEAVKRCNKTLENDGKDIPMQDRVRNMGMAFKEFGVTMEQIEAYLGYKKESFCMQDLTKMSAVLNSLKDGMLKREDVFDMTIKEETVEALAIEQAAEPPQEPEPPKKKKQSKAAAKKAEQPPREDAGEQPSDLQREIEENGLPFK